MSTIMKFATLLLTACLCIAEGEIFGQSFSPYSNGYFNPGFGHNFFSRPNYAGYPSFPPRVINPYTVPRYSFPYSPSPYIPQYYPLYYPSAPVYFPNGLPFGAGKFPVTPAGASQGTTVVTKPAGSPSTTTTVTTTTKPGTTSGSSTTPSPSTSVTEFPVTGDEDTVSVDAAA